MLKDMLPNGLLLLVYVMLDSLLPLSNLLPDSLLLVVHVLLDSLTLLGSMLEHCLLVLMQMLCYLVLELPCFMPAMGIQKLRFVSRRKGRLKHVKLLCCTRCSRAKLHALYRLGRYWTSVGSLFITDQPDNGLCSCRVYCSLEGGVGKRPLGAIWQDHRNLPAPAKGVQLLHDFLHGAPRNTKAEELAISSLDLQHGHGFADGPSTTVNSLPWQGGYVSHARKLWKDAPKRSTTEAP